MPSKNSVKKYVSGGVYHIYNRGVEKRPIFIDDQDYSVFLNLFKIVLSPKEALDNNEYIRIKNKAEAIELISYCLMPNHFHLLVKQSDVTDMSEFMQILMTAYVAYFNKKYKRVGSLFQGRYKAALIDKDEYLTHVSRYIHMNPMDLSSILQEYSYSSYKYYVSNEYPEWLKPQLVLNLFQNPRDYKKFVNDHKVDSLAIIKEAALDYKV